MELKDPITKLGGVGDLVAAKFAILNIHSVEDLLTRYPSRYIDFSNVTPINKTRPGTISIKVVIKQVTTRRSRHGLSVTEAVASDETGSMHLIWFNQPYRGASLKKDVEYYVSGDFGLNRQRMSMINPSIELVSDFTINTARIIPVYRETKGLKSGQIRRVIKNALVYLKLVNESLPEWLLSDYKLMPIVQAIETMHFPADANSLNEAKNRIAYEELFDLSLAAQLSKNELMKQKALPIKYLTDVAKEFVAHLDFSLTDEQKRAAHEILKDIEKNVPMNRLIEGDVGTGKTVVATMAAYMAIKEDFQIAFMAPTELLARQHAETIYKILDKLGYADRVSLLVGSQSAAQKKLAVDKLKKSETMFIIGTHSLIQESVEMARLGLVVIDEQHRFGVNQRQALLLKSGHMPHLLSMTATPIPRSLQLTLYGDLDISIIKHKPYSNLPVITSIINLNRRKEIYESLKTILDKGQQVFVVCPLIKESQDLPFRSAEKVYAEISKGVFKNYNVGLLHGQLKTAEKEAIMADFVSGKTNVLVATTIVEVGVDVPNASVMMIESAERFGLAQVHQLRGRVGRSDQQGYCYLLLDDSNQPSPRIRALESTNDGFKLAELDLKIRGPGAIYGFMQHGHDILDLQVAQLTDLKLIQQARAGAQAFIDKKENLLQYIQLNERVKRIRSITNLN